MKKLNGIYKKNIENQKIDYYNGTACFEGPRVVAISNEGNHKVADNVVVTSEG